MNDPTTLILDGIWGRPKRFGPLRRAIEPRCGPTDVFRYNVSGMTPFETLGRLLCETIRALDGPVNLVAFSMGGIVVRMARLLDPDLPIRRAVFLNTPHAGTILAYALPLPGVRQMRPGSELMRRLAEAPWDIPTMVTWCPLDAIIVPGRSAKWPKASESICCRVPAHTWPIWSSRIHQRIAAFLGEDDACGCESQAKQRRRELQNA
ncbi:MAG TPA: hypothetical protein VH475_08445 [Tepidisphaeraceae bacterium]